MDLLQIIAKDTMHFCFGLFGFCLIYFIGSTMKDFVEGLVDWVADRIDAVRRISSVR